MKTLKFIIALVLIVSNLVIAAERAERPVAMGKEGHGGYGVLLEGKPYLLDLVENGVEHDPYFNLEIKLNQAMKNDLSYALYNLNLSTEELNLLVRKLTEIENESPILAFTYFAAIKLYTWKLINQDLVNSPDFSSVVRVDNRELVSLANRKEQYVRINGKLWKELDAGNKVALIFHEMTYAFISDEIDEENAEPATVVAQSAKARDITGYLFSIDFKIKGIRGFRVINNYTIPFEFTAERVNIFNHTWQYDINGFVLKRGILNVSLSPIPSVGLPPEFFTINQSSEDSIPSYVENRIRQYCERLEEYPRVESIRIELKTDSLKDVFVMFEKGHQGSHLTIKENQPQSEVKIINGSLFRTSSCEQVLVKEIYLKNRFYTPLDNLSEGR